MASVFPIDLDELRDIARRAAEAAGGVLEVVNLNSPTQHVLSGDEAALAEARRIVEEETYAQCTVIERRVPMHCSTFEPVGRAFREHLAGVRFRRPSLPYFPNRLGRPVPEPDQATFVELLSTHVHKPVLWRASIDYIVEHHGPADRLAFVEVGPMAVLTNLLGGRWHRGVRRLHTDSRQGTAAHLREVVRELGGEPGPVAGG